MQRRVGARTARCANLAARRVESREGRIRADAAPKSVHGAAVKLRSFADRPFVHADLGAQEAQFFPEIRHLHRIHARSADLRIEQPAHRQRLVADHFGVHPEARAAGEQTVEQVLLEKLIVGDGALAIRGGGDDEAEDVFYIPTVRR